MPQVIQTRKILKDQAASDQLREKIQEQKSALRGNTKSKAGLSRFFTSPEILRQIEKQIQATEHLTLRHLKPPRVLDIIRSVVRDYETPELSPCIVFDSIEYYSADKLEALIEFTKCLCELEPQDFKNHIEPRFARILWNAYKRREGLTWVD